MGKFILILCFIAAIYAAVNTTPGTQNSKAVSPSPSEFDVKNIDAFFEASPIYTNKPVIIHFWGTWCPPCIEEMPHIIRAANRNPSIKFVMISVDEESKIERFLSRSSEKTGKNVNFIPDPQAIISRGKFGINSYPQTIVLSEDRKHQYLVSSFDWQNMVFWIPPASAAIRLVK